MSKQFRVQVMALMERRLHRKLGTKKTLFKVRFERVVTILEPHTGTLDLLERGGM